MQSRRVNVGVFKRACSSACLRGNGRSTYPVSYTCRTCSWLPRGRWPPPDTPRCASPCRSTPRCRPSAWADRCSPWRQNPVASTENHRRGKKQKGECAAQEWQDIGAGRGCAVTSWKHWPAQMVAETSSVRLQLFTRMLMSVRRQSKLQPCPTLTIASTAAMTTSCILSCVQHRGPPQEGTRPHVRHFRPWKKKKAGLGERRHFLFRSFVNFTCSWDFYWSISVFREESEQTKSWNSWTFPLQ